MSRRTITLIAWIVIAFYCALFAKAIGKPGGLIVDDQGRPAVVDYVAMWAAGNLALEGRPAAAYDPVSHKAAQDRGLGYDTEQTFPWAYPPTYFAVVATFSLLPYLPSLILFTIATLAFYAVVNARIVGSPEGAIWMLATTATFWCLSMGQNGMLNAALLGAGLLLVPARPALAGACFGLLSYKPHLGLLIPFALAAAGQWRAFAAAAGTTLALALASLPLFGLGAWTAFFAAISEFGTLVLSPDYERPHRLQSLYGLLRSLGAPPTLALGAQMTWAAAMAAAIVVLWRGHAPYALKAAGLATGAVLASPYLFIYDFPVLSIAQAFLVHHMLATGPSITRVAPLVAASLLIAAFPILKLPTGFLAALITGAIVAMEAAAIPRLRSAIRPA